MIDRFFLQHPRAVGESYGEHLLMASRFGLSMVFGGIACLIHALLPNLFVTTASNTISRLHERMVLNRRRTPKTDDKVSG